MIKFPQLDRRHVVGASALALIFAALAFVAGRDFSPRPVASLSEMGGPQQAANETFESQFLSSLRRVPANAFGSAEALKPDDEPNQPGAASPASESKFWSDAEWQAASKAVAGLRSGHNAAGKTSAVLNLGALTWRPPEEIARQKSGGKAQ